MIGKKVLNYEIKSLIGEGGMGSVYLAVHSQMNRKVAIKVLMPRFSQNEEIKQRFKNEASTMAHLHHPHIVSLYDYLEDETGMYLIMEYVEGVPLDDFITNVTGPVPGDKAFPIMKQVLSAFQYAHGQGVIHRDIKPANIIIGTNGDVKILDFGIARLLGDEANHLTKTGTQMGTIFYMSPEQVQGKKADHRSDIYSLGVTFYQMLTGINPYKGITTEYEVYNRIVKEDLPNPREIYPGVPEKMVEVLRKALSKDPEGRFQSCNEFLAAIENGKIEKPKVQESQKTEKKSVVVPPSNHKSNGSAVASLVLGIISIITCWIPVFNVLSIILGIIALITGAAGSKKAKLMAEYKNTGGPAVAGKILAIIAIVVSLLILVFTGLAQYNKDSDGDGVYDRIDECKWEYGTRDQNGCPDMDGDGVLDTYDGCPNQSGSSDHNGCPDTDGDGVYDSEDNCVNESGPSDNSGCPWEDTDHDGITDNIDDCPSEYGTESNSGCPEYEESEDYGGYDGYEGSSEEYESSTYTTVCPYCENRSTETRYNLRWRCGNSSCGKSFYGCKKKNSYIYGIKLEWIDDNECDCDDCSDE